MSYIKYDCGYEQNILTLSLWTSEQLKITFVLNYCSNIMPVALNLHIGNIIAINLVLISNNNQAWI